MADWSPVRVCQAIMKNLIVLLFVGCCLAKSPEASSTLLYMQKLYLSQPPHDTLLYDILQVSSNATHHEITKNYRKLSRKYHPDKHPDGREHLERVQSAYEVLKTDRTRLHYHRHGLVTLSDAVTLLMGQTNSQKPNDNNNPRVVELLQLMGYNQDHSNRVYVIAYHLLERTRPVIEGTLHEHYLLQDVIEQADRLKRLPLGGQIVRCIGRAYRYAGQRYLRNHPLSDMENKLRDQFRSAKQLVHAALLGGRAVLQEQLSKKQAATPKAETIEWDGGEFGEPFDLEVPSDSQLSEQEQRKAKSALLESLQVEALWKISKMDLDKTIRRACELILESGAYGAFYHQHHQRQPDGWIGENHQAICSNTARFQFANLLIKMGDCMVQRSKIETSWME